MFSGVNIILRVATVALCGSCAGLEIGSGSVRILSLNSYGDEVGSQFTCNLKTGAAERRVSGYHEITVRLPVSDYVARCTASSFYLPAERHFTVTADGATVVLGFVPRFTGDREGSPPSYTLIIETSPNFGDASAFAKLVALFGEEQIDRIVSRKRDATFVTSRQGLYALLVMRSGVLVYSRTVALGERWPQTQRLRLPD